MTTFAFDFDKTLAATACAKFEDYADPSFVRSAKPLPLVVDPTIATKLELFVLPPMSEPLLFVA